MSQNEEKDIEAGRDAARASVDYSVVERRYRIRNWKNRAVGRLKVKAKDGELQYAKLRYDDGSRRGKRIPLHKDDDAASFFRTLMGDRYDAIIGDRIQQVVDESNSQE